MAVPPPDYHPPPWLEWVRARIWYLSFALGVVAITVVYPFTRYVPEPPEVMFPLPETWGQLVDHHGQPFTPESMRGKVWVAGFIFTRCPSSCPAVTAAMKELRARFDRTQIEVEMVSFTVDPEHDTPEILANYAASVGAENPKWHFVTGPRRDLEAFIDGGFRLGIGEKTTTEAGLFDIAHSNKLALVDEVGGIRGYYSTTSSEGLDEAYERADRVWMETKRRPPLFERLGLVGSR